MHQAAHDYIARFASTEPLRIFEIGSRDINGSVRDLFPRAVYTGLDLYPGPGVDLVVDAERWWPPFDDRADLVICCEVLEHTPRWPQLIETAASWIKTGGRLLITCAGPGRRPHSGVHGRRNLVPDEYYGNVHPDTLAWVMSRCGLRAEVESLATDTRAQGRREA